MFMNGMIESILSLFQPRTQLLVIFRAGTGLAHWVLSQLSVNTGWHLTCPVYTACEVF